MSTTKTSCRSIFNINLPEDYKIKHVFVPIKWKGLNAFNGEDVWSDGVNIYCSKDSSSQYILNKSNMTWETKRWSGSFTPVGRNVWSDGINVFYSSGTTQYVLNNGTWEKKTWTYSPYAGSEIIQFEDKLYCISGSGDLYVYNGSDFDYIDMALVDWTVSISFIGSYLWTDGEKLYYSVRDEQYLMDLDSRQIVAMEWGDYEPKGYAIWSDGTNVYCDHPNPSMHHKLVNGVWVETEWNGLYGDFRGDFIWTDGENIYFSENGKNYIILPSTAQMYQHTNTGNTGWAKVGMTVTYPLPTEVATETEMTALLETAKLGAVYKYIGETTDTYENGALYVVDEESTYKVVVKNSYEVNSGSLLDTYIKFDTPPTSANDYIYKSSSTLADGVVIGEKQAIKAYIWGMWCYVNGTYKDLSGSNHTYKDAYEVTLTQDTTVLLCYDAD